MTRRAVRTRRITRGFWMVAIGIPLVATLFTAALGQDVRLVRGEKVFSTTCSVPYCHGPNGTGGRAPKLAGHNFTISELTNTVSKGIANKGMPAFAGQLSADDLDAVIGYVMMLHSSPAAGTASPSISAAAALTPGKALFFDAPRMGGCGRCHELEKRGSPVAPELKNIPSDLRAVNATHIVTVSAAGEAPFPGVVVEQSEKRVRVYDLSSKLPVLRTFSGSAAKITPGSTWKHGDALAGYSDAELREIAGYLQSVITK